MSNISYIAISRTLEQKPKLKLVAMGNCLKLLLKITPLYQINCCVCDEHKKKRLNSGMRTIHNTPVFEHFSSQDDSVGWLKVKWMPKNMTRKVGR